MDIRDVSISFCEQKSNKYGWTSIFFFKQDGVSSVHMLRNGIAEPYGRAISGFLRTRHTDFRSGYTSLLSQQQRMKICLSLCPN